MFRTHIPMLKIRRRFPTGTLPSDFGCGNTSERCEHDVDCSAKNQTRQAPVSQPQLRRQTVISYIEQGWTWCRGRGGGRSGRGSAPPCRYLQLTTDCVVVLSRHRRELSRGQCFHLLDAWEQRVPAVGLTTRHTKLERRSSTTRAPHSVRRERGRTRGKNR